MEVFNGSLSFKKTDQKENKNNNKNSKDNAFKTEDITF